MEVELETDLSVVFWDDGTITPCDRSPSRRENRTEPRDKRAQLGLVLHPHHKDRQRRGRGWDETALVQ